MSIISYDPNFFPPQQSLKVFPDALGVRGGCWLPVNTTSLYNEDAPANGDRQRSLGASAPLGPALRLME